MKPAIRVQNLSKQYQLGARQSGGYRTLREGLADACTAPWRKARSWMRGEKPSSEPGSRSMWALNDVSFDVAPGEVVGIIGRNGAGKSTLLKVLSKITEPTAGHVEIRGRIASLLEVGTGFHPELTGRENIYLNGAILGMRRSEIQRKFDDIVEFAEVKQFLDTPVKRYSSGMYVRLAFAVAAYLEPEILVVDEVLAVGDLAFQKKCLDRMKDLGRRGDTILFVSHNMGTIASLCDRGIVMDQGRVASIGDARSQICKYLEAQSNRSSTMLCDREDRTGNGVARVTEISFINSSGAPVQTLCSGDDFAIRFQYKGSQPLRNVELFAWVCNEDGIRVTSFSNRYTGAIFPLCAAEGVLRCRVPRLTLTPGRYLLDFTLLSGLDVADHMLGAVGFDVEPGAFFTTGRIPPKENAAFLCDHSWDDAV